MKVNPRSGRSALGYALLKKIKALDKCDNVQSKVTSHRAAEHGYFKTKNSRVHPVNHSSAVSVLTY